MAKIITGKKTRYIESGIHRYIMDLLTKAIEVKDEESAIELHVIGKLARELWDLGKFEGARDGIHVLLGRMAQRVQENARERQGGEISPVEGQGDPPGDAPRETPSRGKDSIFRDTKVEKGKDPFFCSSCWGEFPRNVKELDPEMDSYPLSCGEMISPCCEEPLQVLPLSDLDGVMDKESAT